VSILLEVVDDANQEQIKKKKLLTSQVLVILAFLISFLRKKTKLKSKNKFFLLLSRKKRKQKQLFLCDSRLAYVTLGFSSVSVEKKVEEKKEDVSFKDQTFFC